MKNHFQQQHQKRKKNTRFRITRPLQLIHLLFGGSFIRPRIIFSFRSSSFLLPIVYKNEERSRVFHTTKTNREQNSQQETETQSSAEEFKEKKLGVLIEIKRRRKNQLQSARSRLIELLMDYYQNEQWCSILNLISSKVVRKNSFKKKKKAFEVHDWVYVSPNRTLTVSVINQIFKFNIIFLKSLNFEISSILVHKISKNLFWSINF